MAKKTFLALFVGIFLLQTGFGQFTTVGDASEVGCNCFQLTNDVAGEQGSFHKTSAINLNTPFHLKFTVNFGCEPTGGEGLAFIMQSAGWTEGAGGFGLGYDGLAGNSLTVEFDTRDNDASGEVDNWDVPSDHISLQDNGDSDHEPTNPNNLLGIPSGLNIGETPTPHPIKPGFPNVEDCEDHLVEIIWTPGVNQTIQIKVDNITSLTYIGNMITTQFGGNPNVLWGWTGTTGVFSNVQTVCLALLPDFAYTATNCPGETINFTGTSSSFNSITDWGWDFGGIGTSALENPSFSFPDAGIYPVVLTITDSDGCEESITVDIPVGFDTEVTADDSAICPGSSTVLHALGDPFESTECCFKLVLNDLWGDYWGSGVENEVEIIADGVSYGFYSPTSYDPGSGTSDTIDLCFEQGTELEFVIHGADSPAECSYYFLSEDLTEILSVNGAVAGTWVDGASELHTVDCGLVPPDYSYLWDNAPLLSDETIADPTATLAATTWFHVEITDPATGCTIIDSILITVNPTVTAVISGYDQICDGDDGELTVTFSGSPPYNINVNGPGGALPAITGIPSSPYTLLAGDDGTYTLTFVSGDGCEGTFSGSGEIDVVVPFEVDIEASATYCDGDPIADLLVVDTDGGIVNWYDNPGLVPPAIATGLSYTPPALIGIYTYYAAETEAILGCEGPADEVTITINAIPPAPAYSGITTHCEGDDATILIGEPSLGGSLTWYDSPPPGGLVLATSLSYTPPLVPPGFTLYLTETADGCEGPATTITITINPTPDPPAVSGETEYCEGDAVSSLTATPGMGGTIEWRNMGGVLLGTGTTYTPILVLGTTSIFVTETIGSCTSEPTEISINVQLAPTINLPDSLAICAGDSILVTAENNGGTITWSDGQEGESVWLSPIATTTIIGTATNPACGSASDEIILIVNPLPTITTSNDTIIGLGGGLSMWAASEDALFFTWSPAILSCANIVCGEVYAVPDRPTVYIVTATDENECENSDSIVVDMNGIMELFVPNIFSPNGDGSNDELIVFGPRIFEFSMEIYDRWGKRVYKSNDQNEHWDGTFDDKTLSPQTFVYIITGINVLGEKIKFEGNVTIIK